MQQKELTKIVDTLMNLPLADLHTALSGKLVRGVDWHELTAQLDATAIKAITIAAYANSYASQFWGAGDGDHATNVAQANKARTQARKILGYSYPKSGKVNF